LGHNFRPNRLEQLFYVLAAEMLDHKNSICCFFGITSKILYMRRTQFLYLVFCRERSDIIFGSWTTDARPQEGFNSSRRRRHSSPRAIRRAAGVFLTLDALSTSAVSAGMSASRAACSARVIDQTDYITTVAAGGTTKVSHSNELQNPRSRIGERVEPEPIKSSSCERSIPTRLTDRVKILAIADR
jgi:hypothetical protein